MEIHCACNLLARPFCFRWVALEATPSTSRVEGAYLDVADRVKSAGVEVVNVRPYPKLDLCYLLALLRKQDVAPRLPNGGRRNIRMMIHIEVASEKTWR